MYVLRVGALTLSAGPELEVLVQPLAVQLNGSEVFRVPRFSAGFAVGVRRSSGG